MICPCCGSRVSDSIDIRFDKTDAYYQGKPLKLTPHELTCLRVLWNTDFIAYTTLGFRRRPDTTTASYITRVRNKLAAVGAPYVIRPVRGEGYVLQPRVEGVNA